MKMTRTVLVALVSSFLFVSCISQNLSEREVFRSCIGRELITQRPTYIYNFNADGFYELWDHPFQYGQVRTSGEAAMKEEKPLYVVPTGSCLRIREVVKEHVIDNPPAIEARGVLQLEGRELPITYLWGIYDRIHKAPWESAEFSPRETVSIEPGGAVNGSQPIRSETNGTSAPAGSRR